MRSPRVALATCAAFPELFADDRLLLPALEAAGIAWDVAVWTDPGIDWRSYDAVVIRSIWDYFERFPEFRAWLACLEKTQARVLNPVSTLLANCDKGYLRDLAARGVATLPTLWIGRGSQSTEVKRLLATVAWEELVVKPSVSGNAFRTERVSLVELLARRDPLAVILGDSDALVQPFMPEITRDGEWSFLFFGGAFSHALCKRPQRGDFRVQATYGGVTAKADPAPALLAQAEAVLTAARQSDPGAGELYARVDGIVREGTFLLIELELIEPFLFLGEDPESPRRFVAALRRLLDV